ncbi:MAG: hypothetical protein LBG27_08720 [Spirochaetaceae bacterium]|jgi:hypothetical protein|nr:hypothetical protein [Spirochaetaceae bacterium]
MDDNGIKKSITITRDISGIALRIEYDPLKNNPKRASFEMRRSSPKADDKAPLDIIGLTKDTVGNPGKFYFLRQGSFNVPGPFWAGDKLTFNTLHEAEVQGTINFEFREARKVETPLEFEGSIIFEPKKGDKTGTLSDFEGKIMLKPLEPIEEVETPTEEPTIPTEGSDIPTEGEGA